MLATSNAPDGRKPSSFLGTAPPRDVDTALVNTESVWVATRVCSTALRTCVWPMSWPRRIAMAPTILAACT